MLRIGSGAAARSPDGTVMVRPVANSGRSADEHIPFGPPGSRFAAVTRRAFLTGSAVFSASAMVGLTSCGHNDQEVFARGATPNTASRGSTSTVVPRGSVAPGTSRTSTTSTTSPAATNPPTTTTGEVAVHFTYQPAGGRGRVNNPYVATWIENGGGELVATLGLWYLQGPKGRKWLNDLRRWSSVDGSPASTTTSATRAPGDYAVLWAPGDSAARGEYFVCIESAREHGPYSLIRQQFTLGDGPFTTTLPSQGELTNASIEFPAK